MLPLKEFMISYYLEKTFVFFREHSPDEKIHNNHHHDVSPINYPLLWSATRLFFPSTCQLFFYPSPMFLKSQSSKEKKKKAVRMNLWFQLYDPRVSQHPSQKKKKKPLMITILLRKVIFIRVMKRATQKQFLHAHIPRGSFLEVRGRNTRERRTHKNFERNWKKRKSKKMGMLHSSCSIISPLRAHKTYPFRHLPVEKKSVKDSSLKFSGEFDWFLLKFSLNFLA